MTAPDPSLHRWCLDRLAALRVGLLGPTDEERLHRHLDICPTCREAYEGMAPSAVGDVGHHIPPDLLARWDRAAESLRGVERAMVREHLGRCDRCREELRLLGHEPVLDYVAALEPSPEALPVPTAELARAPGPREHELERQAERIGPMLAVTRPPTSRERRRWLSWVLGSWAAAATAAAALLIVFRAPAPVGQGGGLPPEPLHEASAPRSGTHAGSTAPASPGGMRLEQAAIVVLESTTRGSASRDTLAQTLVTTETRALVIGVPTERLFDVRPDVTIRVEVGAPSGQILLTTSHTLEQLLAERALVLGTDAPLPPGTYFLRLTPDGHPPVEARFRIRVATGH